MRRVISNFSKENLLYVFERTKKFIIKHKFLVKALLINVIVYCILMLLYYAKYESDLDIFMQVLLYGVGANGSVSHNVFNNIIIGKILEILFGMFPTIACYTYFHYALVFLSLTVICYIMLKRNNSISGIVITVLITFFMGYEGYVLPNYLKTSMYLCISALYLLVFFSIRKHKKKRLKILAGVMIVVSFLISIKAFFLGLFLGIIGIIVFCSSTKKCAYLLKQNMSFFIVVGIILGLMGSLNTISYMDDNWKLSQKYRNSIEKMYSFGYPDFSEEIEDEIQLKEVSYEILTLGGFVGHAEPQLETIQDIVKVKKVLNVENIRLYFKSVVMNFFSQGLFYCWITLILIFFLSQKELFKKVFMTSSLMILGTSLFLYSFNAISYNWIYSLIFIPTILYCLLNMKDLTLNDMKENVVYFFILCAIINIVYSNNLTSSINNDEMETAFIEVDEASTIEADLNSYFRSFSVFKVYPEKLVDSYEFCVFNGIYLLGGGLEDNVRVVENPEKKYEWINGKNTLADSALRSMIRKNGLVALYELELECQMRQ